MADSFQTLSPIDGSIVCERPFSSEKDTETALEAATEAKREWRSVPLSERIERLNSFVDAVVARKSQLADELTLQMGRPRRYTEGEIGGFEDRARRMLGLATSSLAPIDPGPKKGFTRRITRDPIGTVLTLAPWNYPWLTAVNAIVPAMAAGNVVILKHSDQTPLVSERLSQAASEAGLPRGVFQHLHASHEQIARIIGDSRVDFVAFTGSVEGGRAVHRAAAERFIHVGLELGGKDPAYVAADANLEHAVENLVDGAFFNSGQSCCAIERIYVHESHFDRFVDAFVALTEKYVLGDPREPETTLGPVVRTRNAESIRSQVDAAIAAGARPLISGDFPGAERGVPYLAPQVLVDVTHEMDLMREETFGPAIGIMKVGDDDEAVARMNDSRFGLTAAIWTSEIERAERIGRRLETGTVFMNRCDYLDPELAWVGVKDSGNGCTLSSVGYEQLTRPKSFHLRHA